MAGSCILYVRGRALLPRIPPPLCSLPLPPPVLSSLSVPMPRPLPPHPPRPTPTPRSHQFYTLSAGFRLRIPMPPYLPPAEPARERLVDAIRDLDVVKRRSVRGGGRHLLFFAYALAMQEVIAELDYLGGLLQDAFGVISQSGQRDFEELFSVAPEFGEHGAPHLVLDPRDSSFHFRTEA